MADGYASLVGVLVDTVVRYQVGDGVHMLLSRFLHVRQRFL